MKRNWIIVCVMLMWAMTVSAGITTYTFTSYKWTSKVEATVCDGITDGWVCNKEAYNEKYAEGHYDAQGLPWGWGVDVKQSTSGAGATSVLVFEDVRRVVINFCQNKSKGKGVIHVQVGSNPEQTITVNKPTDGKGDYNRDSVIQFTTPQTGKIKFWVDCTENAIYINSISIRSASGGSSIFTIDTYQLVTDVAQIKDSDQVIFGVHKDGVNYIMGYFDEYESANNIHAIKGKYSDDRASVAPDDRAVYTLRIKQLDNKPAYIFQDEIRYEEAYLVASGGQTKNRLALWTDTVDTKTYGHYGYWDIRIENGGEAVITNLGNSKAKIIQYNASNNPTLFACYSDRSQTPVSLYRRVEAMGDVAAIVAPFVNFGTTLKTSDKRTITVNANKLTQEISATLKKGDVFSLSSTTLDRDGDMLTISYNNPAPGHYIDTLVLESGTTRTEVEILLSLQQQLSVAEAVQSEDHAVIYLKDVVVTKKYDNYIYVRDETGSMLLFDRGDGETGKRYGSKIDEGYILSGTTGRFINYFGVPEISLSDKFSNYTQGENVQPEPAPAVIDSADVCRYLLLEDAVVSSWTELTYKGKKYAVENKFKLASFIKNTPTRTFVIVSYDRDVVTLYIVKQETAADLEALENNEQNAKRRVILRDGIVLVETENGLYTMRGEKH